MAFNVKGFRTLDFIGTPDTAGAAGTNRALHAYITNDDAATVETANYFDEIIGRLKTGDLLEVSLDNDGVIGRRGYIITAAGGHVTLTGENKLAGAGVQILAFYMNLAEITANGDLLTNFVPGYAFKLESFDWRQMKPVTTGAKAASLNLEIGTTDVTGGVIALTSAACTPQGVAVAGSAITAANVGTATDSFSIEASGVTAFAEGSGWALVKIRNLET